MKNTKTTSIFIIFSLSIMLFCGCNSTTKKTTMNTKTSINDTEKDISIAMKTIYNDTDNSIISINKTNTQAIKDIKKNEAGISEYFPRYTFDGYIPALYGNQAMQSIIYIPEDDVIISGYKLYSGTEGLCTLRKWNRKTKKLITNYDNLNLYHCSDMTYNPNTKEIFISTNTDPRARNYISVYDYTTMTFKREFQYNYKSIVYGIAYSKLHNQFVFYDNSDIRICDANMVSQSVFNVPNLGMNYQSIEVYKNYVYIYYDIAIQVYDFQGNYITTYKIDTLDEGEGICYIGDGKFLIGRVINTPMATASVTSRVYIFDTLTL